MSVIFLIIQPSRSDYMPMLMILSCTHAMTLPLLVAICLIAISRFVWMECYLAIKNCYKNDLRLLVVYATRDLRMQCWVTKAYLFR